MNFLKKPTKRPLTHPLVTSNANVSKNAGSDGTAIVSTDNAHVHALAHGEHNNGVVAALAPIACGSGSVLSSGTSSGANSGASSGCTSTDNAHDIRQAFTVMWGTYKPGKKHKVWEDDAILCRNGRLLILKDLSGKELDREFGFSNQRPVVEGDIVRINGRECLIESVIDYNDYLSGQCFQSSSKPSKSTTRNTLGPTIEYRKQNFKSTLVKSRYSRFSIEFEREQSLAELMAAQAKPLQMPKLGLGANERPVMVDQRLTAMLREHQREGVVYMYECVMGMRPYGQGCILADDMGLGKTLQCITCIHTLLKSGPIGKPVLKSVLVLTPSSLVRNWKREFDKWIKDRQINVYAVDGKKRTIADFVRQRLGLYQILIVSYETFYRQHARLASFAFDMLVCDEAHRLKNSRTKIVQVLSTNFDIKRKILLTGTPIQNNLQEMYTLCTLANHNCYGTYAEFRKYYENPILKGRSVDASEHEVMLSDQRADEMSDILTTFCIRRHYSIMSEYLPAKVEHVVICKLSALQNQIYKAVLNGSTLNSVDTVDTVDEAIEVNAGHGAYNQLLPYISFLRKLCNHPLLISHKYNEKHYALKDNSLINRLAAIIDPLFPIDQYRVEQQSGKFDVLCKMLQMIVEHDQRVVIVSNFTKTLDLIGRYCFARNYATVRLEGCTRPADRQQLVDQFNRPYSPIRIFLLSSKAGGCGLNLVGASYLILYDIDWNPANDAQAMARIWRDGQKNTAHLYRLVTAGTIEERMLQRQMSKQGLTNSIQTHIDFGSKTRFSKHDLRDLFTLKEDTLSITHDLLDCNCQHQSDDSAGEPPEVSNSPTHGPDHEHQETDPVDQETINDDHPFEDETNDVGPALLTSDQPSPFDPLVDDPTDRCLDEDYGGCDSPVMDLWTPSQNVRSVFDNELIGPDSDSESNCSQDKEDDPDVDPPTFVQDEHVHEPPPKRFCPEPSTDSNDSCHINLSSLKDWEHFAYPFDNSDLDKLLMLASESINFVYRHITNRTQSNG